PAHNIIGTTGQKLYGQVGSWFDQHHDDSHVYKFNKNRYSSFQNTNLDNYLRERWIDEVWIAGVCTDICVLHTAISAYNLDYHIVIPQAAVATFSPAGAEWAMNHFKNVLGATIR
ncbi:cysteine hydrolase, partial [Lactobacillus salivarius]|uniref:cysteine hydrolase family protein n=2 Tax=Lactobacillales TaxID=186826 RepID=UPI00136A28D2